MRQHGVRVLSERDRELLRFVGDQYLVTLPQLAHLADRSPRTARWLRTRWQRTNLIAGAKLLVDEPTVIWLTRHGLAALGLAWKTVQPSYGSISTLAGMVELRLAAHAQYPHARWLSRRVLSHACPVVPSPLPDALLTSDYNSVAILAKPRELHRSELERQVLPLIGSYQHVLLVVPEAGRRTRQWFDELADHASASATNATPIASRRPRYRPSRRSSLGPRRSRAGRCRHLWTGVAIPPHRRTPTLYSRPRHVARRAGIAAGTGRQPRGQRA